MSDHVLAVLGLVLSLIFCIIGIMLATIFTSRDERGLTLVTS